MESKHEVSAPTSPTTYTETYRGFTLKLQFGPNGARAVADGPVQWITSWAYSWLGRLEEVRRLVDRYEDARASCARIQQRRELAAQARAAGAGAVDLITRRPAVRS